MTTALIFDMNGTMVDDMSYHAEAWRTMINGELQGNLSPEEVKREMYGKNEEVLERIFGKNKFSWEEQSRISMQKEKAYQTAFRPHLTLIEGLPQFLQKAYQHNIPMAIGTAAIPFNIDFVLDNLDLRHYFKSIISADDVEKSKPHPETFLKAASALGVTPDDCIVFEDSPKGIETALNAGMRAIAVTTMHNKEDFKQYNNILLFIKDYNDEKLQQFIFG
ncbi:MAG: HAD family phosphatase [Bacteroidota bacterium]|nr:HAD family phosphatase [Bacteroidota bacterium]